MDKLRVVFAILFCMILPGIFLYLTSAVYNVFVIPMFGVPMNQILEQPFLEFLLAILGLLSMPGFLLIAILFFIMGLGVIFS